MIIIQFFTLLFSIYTHIVHANEFITPAPVSVGQNPFQNYTLINSVDFHPTKNLFCVTHTHKHKVLLYALDKSGQSQIVQELSNSSAALSLPQHAAFSPNGELLVVANWTNRTINIYKCESNGFYSKSPFSVFKIPQSLKNYRPHGIAFSKCGTFLVVAYGATSEYGRAIGLYQLTKENQLDLLNILKQNDLPGTPKGIAFSQDGNAILVTFCDINSLVVYNFDRINKIILPNPRQVVAGDETGIFRPEDVKITPDGKYCALSNSEIDTVTFYPFDSVTNHVLSNTPVFTLKNPVAKLSFPHGIAFSEDGTFMVVTKFGNIKVSANGGIWWEKDISSSEAQFQVYQTSFK